VGLELNWKHWLLVCADVVNILKDNIDTAKKNTETVIDTAKEIGVKLSPKKTKYVLLSHSVQNLFLLSAVYRTKILSAVMCGCETWSLMSRGEHRLKVFENRVLRGIFG
jgi:hypothetical protein